MAITQVLTAPPATTLNRTSGELFDVDIRAWLVWHNTQQSEYTTFVTQTNATALTMAADAGTATTQAGISTAQAVISTDKAVLTAADRVQTGLDVVATALDKLATNADVILAEADKVQTGLDAAATALDKIATNADVISAEEDKVQTGLDRIATAADKIATNADVISAEEDKVQTGLDRIATAADSIQTGLDSVATGDDRTEVAAIQTALNLFDQTYLGAKTADPTLDNLGAALIPGAWYFNTVADSIKVFNGSTWTQPTSAVNGTSSRTVFTATAAQTTFVFAYDVGFVDVYLNGVKLIVTTDFTATNGTSVVLTAGATVNDTVDLVGYGSFSVANTYTKAEADADTVRTRNTAAGLSIVFGA